MSLYSSSDLKVMPDQAMSGGDIPFADALTAASHAMASPDEQLEQILRELNDRGIGES